MGSESITSSALAGTSHPIWEERLLRLQPGRVVELTGVAGSGLTRLGLRLLAEPSRSGPVVVLDTKGWISPRAAWEAGVAPEHLVVVLCADSVL